MIDVVFTRQQTNTTRPLDAFRAVHCLSIAPQIINMKADCDMVIVCNGKGTVENHEMRERKREQRPVSNPRKQQKLELPAAAITTALRMLPW